jgi:hypothetical protein
MIKQGLARADSATFEEGVYLSHGAGGNVARASVAQEGADKLSLNK